MSEFVKLDKVIESLTESVRSTTVANYVLAKAIKVIATLPTTEIIHCEDCKYWYSDEYETEGYCDLTKYFHMTAMDFCSRGERK
jgi:hypothetical protein